jgi:hypothetical protein
MPYAILFGAAVIAGFGAGLTWELWKRWNR